MEVKAFKGIFKWISFFSLQTYLIKTISIFSLTAEILTYILVNFVVDQQAEKQMMRVDNLLSKKQIDASFHAFILLLTMKFRHNMVKVVCR